MDFNGFAWIKHFTREFCNLLVRLLGRTYWNVNVNEWDANFANQK